MLFCHFLIRLCMLNFRLRDRTKRCIRRAPSAADDEDLAQPQTPIPVILARDEELGLHEADSDNDNSSGRPVQPPPPAYGVWRSSVRANPDLIHWQRTNRPSLRQCEGETPDLAQHPAMRPPSYYPHEPEASSSLYSASPLPILQPVAYRWE
ncbi:MAG: hypothetical protein Q9216_003292 [Gyalolechia sp. 2 TL-2023]